VTNEGKKNKPTEYVILVKDEHGGWHEFDRSSTGGGGQDAIKKATKEPDGTNKPGRFQAVPAVSWDSPTNKLGIKTEEVVQTSFFDPDEEEPEQPKLEAVPEQAKAS
jgi:hypothetical protein